MGSTQCDSWCELIRFSYNGGEKGNLYPEGNWLTGVKNVFFFFIFPLFIFLLNI